MAGLLIGDVAERAGLTAPTIRYYEKHGRVFHRGRLGRRIVMFKRVICAMVLGASWLVPSPASAQMT